jgi:Flp pilus assembly protein TadG
VFLSVAFVVLLAFCSLAVDLGRVQLVKTELRRAADAAARYAITGLPTGVAAAQDWALAAAAENKADGTPVVLDRTLDVEFGTWNPVARSFAPLAGTARAGATAVRVTAPRLKSRGTGLSLMFAGMVGVAAHDLSPSTVVTIAQMQFGLVGLDYIKMGGNSSTSYWSASGSATPGNWGNVASNGDITLAGNSLIQGNARPGPGRVVSGGAGRVTGTMAPLATPLSFPNGTSGATTQFSNSNANLPPGTLSNYDLTVGAGKNEVAAGGSYYLNDVNIMGTITFTGPTTIYCFGTFKLSGRAVTQANLPQNLKIVMVTSPWSGAAPGSVTLGGASGLYASVYAPQSAVYMTGTGDIYGSVLGKSIDMTGTSAIRYDLSLTPSGGAVAIVK